MSVLGTIRPTRVGAGHGFRVPPRLPWLWLLVTTAATLLALAFVATAVHLTVPGPTGPYAVGRDHRSWTDTARLEAHTSVANDHRTVSVQIWFPAQPGTGARTGYVPNLAAIAPGLVASQELNRAQVWGLRWVRHHANDGATVAVAEPSYPLVLLSPGNATNVAFYATLAEDLASRGYVVVGIDHPYQVAAVELPDGSVATYDDARDAATLGDREAVLAARIAERVDDVAFVFERLGADATMLDGRIDTTRVAVVGHSNGGLAAVESCRRLEYVRACANLDGQAAGGPFSTTPNGAAPDRPFLFLTKETALHPVLDARFEASEVGAYRVVLPAAAHEHFADGALFEPTFNPGKRTVDRVAETGRGFVAAFLDTHLRGAPQATLGDVPASTDAYVNVYPLRGRPPLPAP